MIEVMRTSNLGHAEAIRLALLDEGIQAEVSGAALPNFFQDTIRVWIGDEADLPRAREILASLEARG